MLDEDVKPSAAPALELYDAEGDVQPKFVAAVAEAIERGDVATLRQYVEDLHQSDVGALIEALDHDLRARFVELLGAEFDFTALTEVDDTVRDEILEELPSATVAQGLRDLDSDDAVALLEDLDKEDQDEILDHLPASERVALARSLDYPEYSAGRRMQTDYIAVPPAWTVGHAIDYMRETDDLPERFYEIYVIDTEQKLLGAVALDRLLRTKRPVPILDLLDEDHYSVEADENQEEVARTFERYDLVSVPVVDADGRLVGVITIDDIVDVIEEEADEDLKALGGVKGDEELSDSFWVIAKSRFNWLLINLFSAFAAASVLGAFEGQLQQMVALAVLAPMVASQGGNAATQTMTVTVRALATRELHLGNAWRVVRREFMAAAVNGTAFAVIAGTIASLWFRTPDIGLVIGLAMACNVMIGVLGGILIPLGLSRLKADPAVSSGAFVTTVTDVVGFFLFLGIATIWFHLR